MKKFLALFILVVLIVSVLQAGCAPKKPPVVDTPTEAVPTATIPADVNVLPNAISRDIVLDPALTDDADTLRISSYVYDSLTALDASGNPQPALAAKWTVSDDQLDYVIDLRQDIAFKSGAAFNADIVMANFSRWFDASDPLHGTSEFPGWMKAFLGYKGQKAPDGTRISPFDGIEKVNQYTVLIHLNRPMPNLLTELASPSFAILNTNLLAQSGSSAGTSVDTVDGTGAYIVTNWSDSGLALSPNASFWGTAAAEDLQFPWK